MKFNCFLRESRSVSANHSPIRLEWCHCRILSRVSGSLRATRPPHTSAVKDSRIGMALVMPTKLLTTELLRTAASLHKAFRTPNAEALRDKKTNVDLTQLKHIYRINYLCTWFLTCTFLDLDTSSQSQLPSTKLNDNGRYLLEAG